MKIPQIGIFIPGADGISNRIYPLSDYAFVAGGGVHGRNGKRDLAVRARGRIASLPGSFRRARGPARFEGGRTLARVTTLDASLRHAVLSFLKRSGMSGLQFGELALGNPDFVLGLDRRRSLSLDTADRVLRFMGAAPIGPMFRREVDAFLQVTGTDRADLGLKATGDSAFVDKIRGGGSPRLSTVQRVRAWMRRTTSEEESDAIARILAGSEGAAAALSPDPAALDALVEQGSRTATDDARPATADEPAFLTTRQAAAFLSLSPRTLDRYRVGGKGPPFHRLGSRIAYARADLEEWAARKRRGRRPARRSPER